VRLSEFGLRGLLDSLRRLIEKLKWRAAGTEWADYETSHAYSPKAVEDKQRRLAGFLDRVRPATVWDLGANTGLFSRLAKEHGARVLAFDLDPACVERNYLACRRDNDLTLLPLCLDLANPSPGLGWAHRERASLADRGPADLVLALALVHHLAIGNNLPFADIADYLNRLGRHVVIEFVPKDDPQVARLLRSRQDIFTQYTAAAFEAVFAGRFRLLDRQDIADSCRSLYLWERRP
jgi:ribosomal protein L11 methylase PrmA